MENFHFRIVLSTALHYYIMALVKVAIFTIRRTIPMAIGMINHKCVCGALNRQFLVGAMALLILPSGLAFVVGAKANVYNVRWYWNS